MNLLGDDQSSKDCPSGTPIPYTDARLAGKAGANIVASWNLHAGPGNPAVLTDGSYLCPRCGAFGLRFAFVFAAVMLAALLIVVPMMRRAGDRA